MRSRAPTGCFTSPITPTTGPGGSGLGTGTATAITSVNGNLSLPGGLALDSEGTFSSATGQQPLCGATGQRQPWFGLRPGHRRRFRDISEAYGVFVDAANDLFFTDFTALAASLNSRRLLHWLGARPTVSAPRLRRPATWARMTRAISMLRLRQRPRVQDRAHILGPASHSDAFLGNRPAMPRLAVPLTSPSPLWDLPHDGNRLHRHGPLHLFRWLGRSAANATLTNGVGTFSVTLETSGSESVVATTPSRQYHGSANVSVNAGAATHLVIPAPEPFYTAFGFTVSAYDATEPGNLVQRNSRVHSSIPGSSTSGRSRW